MLISNFEWSLTEKGKEGFFIIYSYCLFYTQTNPLATLLAELLHVVGHCKLYFVLCSDQCLS